MNICEYAVKADIRFHPAAFKKTWRKLQIPPRYVAVPFTRLPEIHKEVRNYKHGTNNEH